MLSSVGPAEGQALSKITVKGAPASSEQKKILRRALQLADRWGAPYKAKVALVEALIVESEAKNLGSASADGYGSYGVLQGRDIYHSRKDLMDPDYQIGVFLGKGRGGKKNPKGFTGRGNAIDLSKSGMKSGDIAQAIEGSAYPDRYQGVQREAMRIVRELGGRQVSSGVAPSKVSRAGVSSVDPDLRAAALQQYLSQRKKPGALLALASGLDDAVVQQPAGDVSGAPQTNPEKKKGNGPTARSARAQGLSPLKELFWRGEGGVNAKDGKLVPQGFVSGHQDHVHVAAGPKTIVRLGKRAKDFGLNVGENSHFGGKPTGGHAPNSYHYRDQAIDVSGSPKQMRAYARYIARLYGVGH